MRIGIIGSGIAGLSCAYALKDHHDVVVFEQADRLGGHAHTQYIQLDGREIAVDTGFIVYNDRNYPDLIQLFEELGVENLESEMSFAASVYDGRLEYCGSSPTAVFAQPSNLLKPRFLRMLFDVARFNRLGTDLLLGDVSEGTTSDRASANGATLGAFLAQHGFGGYFRDCYLLPMGAAIWSMPVEDMLNFPARTFLQFFHNHGLLTVNDHPQWRTLRKRSSDYVSRIAKSLSKAPLMGDSVERVTRSGHGLSVVLKSGRAEIFDQVVLASHGDQSRSILDGQFDQQHDYLANFRFQSNDAILHSDPKLMPKRRRAWASWNYLTSLDDQGDSRVSLTYWMNKLQSIPDDTQVFVTLNPSMQPDEALVHNRMVYEHPVFDARAIEAQSRLDDVQGLDGIWLAGAWLGYGFHEDGARSGFDVAAALGAPVSWQSKRKARSWPTPFPLAASA